MCSFATSYLILWKISIHVFAYFLIGLFGLLLLNFSSAICVLVINLLSNEQFANIYSHSVSCFFTFLSVSFAVRTFLAWCNPTCLFWLLLPRLQGSYLRGLCLCQCLAAFHRCCLLIIESLQVLGLCSWPIVNSFLYSV